MSEKNDRYQQVQRRLIATLLYDGSKVNRVLEIVTPDDIQEPTLELIFQSIVNIARKDEQVTPETIAMNLEELGNLAKSGGTKELYALREEGRKYILEAPPNIYAKLVKTFSTRKKVQNILSEAGTVVKDDSGVSVNEAVSDILSELNSILYSLSDDATTVQFNNYLGEYFSLIEERKRLSELNAQVSNGLQGIPSLLPSLNGYTTGWLPGQLITIGARTGIGKSIFAVNSATAAASAGKSVMFFSLEMSEVEITDRIISSMTGISLSKIKKGDLSDEDKEILKIKTEDFSKMKILMDTEPKVTIDSIRAKALRQAQTPEGLDLVIVDYLQLITPVGRFSSRQEAVADMSRNMKLLAKQLQVPIMILVQLNRESKDDENAIPTLDQIRESGAIAQDSDIVILLHRDRSLDDSTPHTLVIIAKNRGGEANKIIRCHSNLETSLFREVLKSKDVQRLTDDDYLNELNEDDLNFDDDVDLDLG